MLSVSGLEAGYGDIRVLRDVSLSVEKGELVCIIGANGAGKSTLLKAICGAIRPFRGTVRFDGRDVTGQATSPLVERGIVRVPEGRKLFPGMTVLENLELGAYSKRARNGQGERLEAVFECFPVLRDRRSDLAGTLSGGLQQMVAVGRGLMARPALLLLDETSLGLSPLVVDNIYEAIARVNRSGVTVVVVEQNTAIALDNASRGYVLENGSMTLQGTAADLRENPHVRRAYLGV